jgi:hypothetical protein
LFLKENSVIKYYNGGKQMKKKCLKSEERAEVWNTYFILAREQALKLKNAKDRPLKTRIGGSTLSEIDAYKLSTILMCNLAIEARINHLFLEYKEEIINIKKITSKTYDYILEHTNAITKWELLPSLVCGKEVYFDINDFRNGHQRVIKDLWDMRHKLIHVKYDELIKTLELDETKVMNYFKNFVEAMEWMNVYLERGDERKRTKEPIQKVLDIGDLDKRLS